MLFIRLNENNGPLMTFDRSEHDRVIIITSKAKEILWSVSRDTTRKLRAKRSSSGRKFLDTKYT